MSIFLFIIIIDNVFFLLLKRNRYKGFIKNFVKLLKIIVKMFAVIKIVFIFAYNKTRNN